MYGALIALSSSLVRMKQALALRTGRSMRYNQTKYNGNECA